MNPKISVVIPVYNGERFIAKTLQRLFSQELPPHEIIVVNDGSTDGTQAVLESMKDRILLKTIPNGGVSNARNVGISMATGEYVAFLDADDFWFRSRLKKITDIIQDFPDVGAFFSDYTERLPYYGKRMMYHSDIVRIRNKILFGRPVRIHGLELFLGYDYNSTPSAVVVKKSVAEKAGGFNAKRRLVEDLDFYLRMAMHTDFILTPNVVLYKYNHDENLSHDTLRVYLAVREVLDEFFGAQYDFLKKSGHLKQMRWALARIRYYIGDLYFEQGDRAIAFKSYAGALRRSFTLWNFLNFLWKVFKKSARVLTFDVLSRKNLWKRRR